jgi:hypothetical protein
MYQQYNRQLKCDGVRLAAPPLCDALAAYPSAAALRDGDDVYVGHLVSPGDDQGQTSSCTIQAWAEFAKVAWDVEVPPAHRVELWRRVRRERYGDKPGEESGGLLVSEAFEACQREGWIPAGETYRTYQDLKMLGRKRPGDSRPIPLVGAYRVTPSWFRVTKEGLLDHTAPDFDEGGHLVLIVGCGVVNCYGGQQFVYVKNSWGEWGANGIGVMTTRYHRQHILEIGGLDMGA